MSKSSLTSAGKTAAIPPQPSAWAKGPPPNANASSIASATGSRSHSPAPHHSRKSSQHAVGIGMGNGPRGPLSKSGNPISFGTVNDKQSPIPSGQPPSMMDTRAVPAFGSIDATTGPLPTNGKPNASTASSASLVPSASASASAAPTPVSTSSSPAPPKPKMDISALFRGNNNVSAPSPTVESMSSPATHPASLSSAAPPPHVQNTPGPNGPSPHAHGVPHPPQGYPPPFVPGAMRNQNAPTPRSPSFSRQVPNGATGRPPVPAGGPAVSNSAMASPRLGPPPHQPPHQHQHPPAPVPGMQPQMAWTGYYQPYYPGMPPMQNVPGAEHYMYAPQQWMQVPQAPHPGGPPLNGPPQTPHAHTHGLPVSPRQPPPPLQPPGTPPASLAAPLPSAGARLNMNANAFVPGQGPQPQQRPSKVKITDASGHELDLNGLRNKQSTTPTTPSTPAMDKSGRRALVRMETEEARLKRIAEENAKKEEAQREKDVEAARKKREEEEEEEQRRKVEEESRRKEEEKERQRLEQERAKKEEEERLKREEEEERLKKEEEERARKAEEERLKKEDEERALLEEEKRRNQEEERERLRKEEEDRERVRLEKERVHKEEEERQQKEEQRLKEEEETSKAQPKERPALEIKSKKEGEASASPTDAPLSTSPESHKKRPIPGPLDLSSANKNITQPLPSALATARHIQDVYQIQYPEGIKSPKLELNANAKDGKFRYDRDFLLQFMSICKEKPDNLPPLEAIGLEPFDQAHSMGRTSSGRRGISGGMPPPSSRQASVGLGINALNGFGKSASGFIGSMGNFSAPNKLSSDERFMRSTSLSGGPGGFAIPGGRASPMVRSSSQGGPGGMGQGVGNKRTRSQRGAARNDSNRVNAAAAAAAASASGMEHVAPLEVSANRWVAGSTKRVVQVDQDSPEVVDRKVRALLNKLTMEKFESISNQIIAWANKSENEKDGRTLIQVIRLVFEKATDEATWSEMYARLCRKMMERISPNVQDDGIRNAEGKPITGGLLFRKYLLNRCQEDFERGWAAKDSTAAAAKAKASEDQAVKEANEKATDKEDGEVSQFSPEYYAAQKAKRQGLGLVKFIGELFKLQMLTERIMHECIKKLLSNVDNPEEEEIESLCKLLSTVGQALDTSKARGHMDVYFSRMKELAKSNNVSSRMQFMLLDVIELRDRKWQTRGVVAAPQTLSQVHEAAAKERVQQERDSLARTAMSRGGSRRGHDREAPQVGPDGWAVASGPSRPANKAGDLSNFGKISKASAGPMQFGPTSVFSSKRDSGKRDSPQLPRPSSSSNMFMMLGSETPAEAHPPPSRPSRPPSRTASVDLSHGAPLEMTQRPKLNLLPRSKVVSEKEEFPAADDAEDNEEGEIREGGAAKKPALSKEQAEHKIDQDVKEFFAIRNLDESEDYFVTLPTEYCALLIEKLVMRAIESKQADAQLVAELFERATTKELCSPASFEEGFMPTAELLDDIAIDAPKAFDLMAIMMQGAKLDEERQSRIASKSEDSEKLLKLLA